MRLDSLDAEYVGLGRGVRCTGWGCPGLDSDPVVAGRLLKRQAAADTMWVWVVEGFVTVSEFCLLDNGLGSYLRC